MKKLIVFLLVLFPLSFECFAEDPKPVKVYCFSEDLEAGFKDGTATYFCEQLAKRGKKKESITLVDLDAAHAKVNFLGRESIDAKGETTYFLGGYAWTPDQAKQGARAVVQVADFTKGFYASGVNDAALLNLWEKVEIWIRENRETILEKASKK